MPCTIHHTTLVLSLLVLVLFLGAMGAALGRVVMDLSGNSWQLWLDKKADWMDDTLFMPPVDMNKVPVNPPTCGWDYLPFQRS